MRKKVIFVIPSLAGGGAERVLIHLLKYIDRKRFELLLVVFNLINAYEGELPKDVRVISLEKKGRFDFFRLIFSLSKVIKKESPSIICTFLTYTNYLSVIARWLSGHKTPLFLSERSNLSMSLKHERLSFLKKVLIKILYPKADCIICISHGVCDDLIANFGIKKEKCKIIYNPIDQKKIETLSKESVNHLWFDDKIPIITACGRLTTPKNYPLLLRAVKLVLEKGVDVRLVILGEGEERQRLESYAKKLGIESNVLFLGFQSNPFKYIARSSVFVLSSSWEGFGNVIVEAMACNTPVISTDCPSGPSEIITDGVNGLLVPVNDEKALSEAIIKLLKNEALRKNLVLEGRKRAEDFKVEKIVKEYEKVFTEAVKCN